MIAVHAMRLAGLAALPVALVAMPAAAQDVKYETATKLELPGTLGAAANLVGRLSGAGTERVETTYIKGPRMRSDAGNSSTIYDVETGEILSLDHAARTFTRISLSEFAERMRAMGEELRAVGEEDAAAPTTDAEARVNFRMKVDNAGQRERVSGFNASRYYMTMEAEGEYLAEEGAQREQLGTFVVLTDVWTSAEVPIPAARARFDEIAASRAAAAGQAMAEGIATILAGDPRLEIAMEQSVAELRKLDGMPVRTVTRFITVPPGETFDRDAGLASGEAGPSIGQQAVRAGLSELRGALGRRPPAQATPRGESEAPKQTTFLTVTTEIRNITTGALDAALFEVPAGYTERAMR